MIEANTDFLFTVLVYTTSTTWNVTIKLEKSVLQTCVKNRLAVNKLHFRGFAMTLE